jgi:type II secretory ATPase GspE/PulE/Tfp pilus assembly ATPase PilB-like protein
MLELTPGVRAAVDRGASGVELLNVAVSDGLVTMANDGVRKARMGLTTLEEVARVVTVLGEETPEARVAA